LHEITIKKIKFEINQINTLLESYQDLLSKVENEAPDLIEIAALASILHSFYNGIENVFQIILKSIDNQIINASSWHKELLKLMTVPNTKRSVVLSLQTMYLLSQYLSFRHFYRHSYSFYLNWKEMKPLVLSLRNVWEDTSVEIKTFLKSLEIDDS